MQKQNITGFFSKIQNARRKVISGQIELTYRCNLSCIYCFCKGSEEKNKELKTNEWKKIIDQIHDEGCLQLCFTGGEPFLRPDFLELYAYAKRKGFLITIFTNGHFFTDKIINYLKKSPPYVLRISLDSLERDIYEKITGVSGSFDAVMNSIKRAIDARLTFDIKMKCLKINKTQLMDVYNFTKQLFGSESHRFSYGFSVFPRFNGDKSPCKHRLSPKELISLWKKYDKEILEHEKIRINSDEYCLKQTTDNLYFCTSWKSYFFINPYGYLRFCLLTDDFSVDVRHIGFKDSFHGIVPGLINQKKADRKSKCYGCRIKSFCFSCPARAYLEKGDKKASVEYYCKTAREMVRSMA